MTVLHARMGTILMLILQFAVVSTLYHT